MVTLPVVSTNTRKKTGLALWMERVLEECDRASVEFAADPVHDLRVALRRCRSMADGIMAIDPDPAWRQMKKAGRRLFRRLGELRDTQIMQEWIHKLDLGPGAVADQLLQHLSVREAQFKGEARLALQEFDHKQWRRWAQLLPRRSARLRQGSTLFRHLALERWLEAHDLHRRALRNRSQTSFHDLRIGIKRFRYIVENFLPEQHQAWKDDLKELQDLLGEVHDLDVLWSTALQTSVFSDDETRSHWHGRITKEREERLEKYHNKMVGDGSLWQVWRAQLPQRDEIEAAAQKRLKFWATSLDPHVKHSEHVTNLALQLYDGLQACRPAPAEVGYDARRILRMAAMLHDVGQSKDHDGHQKTTYRMVRRLKPPLGWTEHDFDLVATVARYHRGALPAGSQKALASIPVDQRRGVLRLAAILRLANAFDADGDRRITRLKVSESKGCVVIDAAGYLSRSHIAEEVAAARYLLELVTRRPVMVRRLRIVRRTVRNKPEGASVEQGAQNTPPGA